MPGKRYERSIKNKKQYHGLRKRGVSKSRAAAISNSGKSGARKGGKRSRRR